MAVQNSFIPLGALLAAAAVILGAFAAHALKSKLSADMLAVFNTAVEYHFLHALGLLIIGLLLGQADAPAGAKTAGWFLLGGILLFSGSLYVLALSGIRQFGMITPIGGLSFIIGWLWLAWSYWRQ